MFLKQVLVFIVRWVASSGGMWLIINWFGTLEPSENNFWFYILAGLVFSVVNSFIRPLVTMFSLPLIILSTGIFTVLINVAMMALTFWLLPGVEIDFWGIFWGTLIMSVINTILNFFIPMPQPNDNSPKKSRHGAKK